VLMGFGKGGIGLGNWSDSIQIIAWILR
jgi:hypothetical protein